VALLRTPELVVQYLEGPPSPEGGFEWAGVFRVDDDCDDYFAAAEPPTHDSWNADLLPKGRGRTIVNVGLREVRTALDNRWEGRKKEHERGATSTALVADELAHLLGGVEARGTGGSQKEHMPGKPKGASQPKVELIASAPRERDGALSTWAQFEVVPAKFAKATAIEVGVAAALDGRDGDHSLDPELVLIEVSMGGSPFEVSGQGIALLHEGSDSVLLDVTASRGSDTAVLFDVTAKTTK
jgi:hypothetical protein